MYIFNILYDDEIYMMIIFYIYLITKKIIFSDWYLNCWKEEKISKSGISLSQPCLHGKKYSRVPNKFIFVFKCFFLKIIKLQINIYFKGFLP